MLFKRKPNAGKLLDEKLDRIQKNVENNYKDAAQLNLKEYAALLGELSEAGRLSEKQRAYYGGRLEELNARLKNFTHKDQKPYWVKGDEIQK